MTSICYKINKDQKLRKGFKEKQSRKTQLNRYLTPRKKIEYTSFKTRAKTRCVITGAAKSVYRRFSLSRHSLRHQLNFGFLPMMNPASW